MIISHHIARYYCAVNQKFMELLEKQVVGVNEDSSARMELAVRIRSKALSLLLVLLFARAFPIGECCFVEGGIIDTGILAILWLAYYYFLSLLTFFFL